MPDTPEKLDLESKDLIAEKLEQLQQLFPNLVTEGENGKVLDLDQLKNEFSTEVVEGTKERYRLEWPGKKEAIVTANLPTTKTLRPVKEDSVDWDTTENLYIEGDNLEVLKILQESYFGKIKMIYIDPPYNTGKDFVYKDNFSKDAQEELEESGQKDEYKQRLIQNADTSGRYHSDWLSMMYPRLKLARNVLSKDGVIFVSLDDNENSNLRKLCDEIFGEQNFLSQVIIQSNKRGQTYKEIAKCHEYVIVYYRSDSGALGELAKEAGSLPHQDKHGEYDLWELRNRNPKFGRHNRPNLYYPFYVSEGITADNNLHSVKLVKDENHTIEVFPKNSEGVDSCWRWGKDKSLNEGINCDPQNIFGKQKRDGGWNIYEKARKSTTKAKSIWNDTAVISEQGTVESGKIEMSGILEFPKPLELVKRCILLATTSKDIVLDFFSGSSTTAHAVMQLNAEDGGKRKHIMVQLPEECDEKSEAFKAGYKNICEIGKERIRRAGAKIKEETGADIDYGFRVYRLDESNMADVYHTPQDYDQDKLELFADNVKEDRTADDLLAQVMLDWGLPLSLPIEEISIEGKRVFKVASNSLMACFEAGIDEDFAKEVAKEEPLRIVFKDAGFANDTAKSNVQQLLKQLSPETEMKVI